MSAIEANIKSLSKQNPPSVVNETTPMLDLSHQHTVSVETFICTGP